MTVINTNVGALNARVAALGAQGGMEKAMQRLSSGLRINQAADDAAGLAVATKMESQLRGINMAIRNSNDGISLVQTAESGMGEISNMVIRMRELSVQMANGIYSDGDRANAQLEVEALLLEIDKIADNTNFNGVKVLNGSYNSEIRAGNTNAEVIGIAVDRMNTDALGGVAITSTTEAALRPSSTFVHTAAKTTMTAGEGQVQINKDVFNSGFTDFTFANGNGTYSLGSEADAALFQVSSSGIVTLRAGELDFNSPTDANYDGTYEFSVTYTNADATESVTEHVVLTITDTATVSASTNTAASTLTVAEAENIEFEVAGTNGVLSDAFKEFVAADTSPNSTSGFSIGGVDGDNDGDGTIAAGDDFLINETTGAITVKTGRFDFENPSQAGATDNEYSFTVTYTNAGGKTFVETVTLNVTDNELADVGIAQTDQELTTTGRSSIQISADNATDFFFDARLSAHRDLLSQGAKDFITRHAGDTLANGEVFYGFTSAITDVTGNQAANYGSTTATFADGTANGGALQTNATLLDINNTADGAAYAAYFDNDTVLSQTGQVQFTLMFGSAADSSAAPEETFTETITLDIVQAGAAGTTANLFVQGAGRTEQSGSKVEITGTSDGQAVQFDMRNRSLFSDLNTYVDNHAGGTFAISAVTDTDGDATNDQLTLAGNVMTLEAGADAGSYAATVTYTDLDGNTYVQTIELETTAATNPSTASVSLVSTDQTKDGSTQSTEVVGGKSTIQVDETLRATIKSTGADTVLSGQLTTFMNSHTSGSWSLSGTDAASFEVDKNGDISSRDIMNYEDKAQYNFNLVYTSGDNVYTESIVLNVNNDTSDDGDHIENLNIGTQAGAQDAINILDTALNQITAAQAKLGSTQNRLQHNIDNLTAASSLTEQARGRITDADFALETSQLSKQQILSQAATSMLAQANQSKQSVLALLQ